MRRFVVLFVAGAAVLGITGCSSSGSSKASSTTTTVSVQRPGSGGSGASNAKGLSAYLKCLGQHGVNVKKVAAAKASGGAGKALKNDPHYAKAQPLCKQFLAS
jgi:ABC-type glycerol-3-phosphate transport system substrate-binding protein